MLKIEVIKFEAQDVITSSVAAAAECTCIEPPYCRRNGSHEACVAAGFEGQHECEKYS